MQVARHHLLHFDLVPVTVVHDAFARLTISARRMHDFARLTSRQTQQVAVTCQRVLPLGSTPPSISAWSCVLQTCTKLWIIVEIDEICTEAAFT
jgi:hypothetical protein